MFLSSVLNNVSVNICSQVDERKMTLVVKDVNYFCYHPKLNHHHSSALRVFLIICLYSLFHESQRQTKIALDQKWVVLFEYEIHFAIRPKLSLNAPFKNFFQKNQIVLKKGTFKAKITARDIV